MKIEYLMFWFFKEGVFTLMYLDDFYFQEIDFKIKKK